MSLEKHDTDFNKPSRTPTAGQPFATTAEKYNTECASREVTGSNFPHNEVVSLPGYTERGTPGLSGSDVTRELARHLAAYGARKICPLPYSQRDIAWYLWLQASRGMLAWGEILKVVRSTKKRDRQKPIAHYYGYRDILNTKGSARDKKLIKLFRYVTQEGECPGCRKEFPSDDLTLDRILPGKIGGLYELRNVQLMCQPCNNGKRASYSGQERRARRISPQ